MFLHRGCENVEIRKLHIFVRKQKMIIHIFWDAIFKGGENVAKMISCCLMLKLGTLCSNPNAN
jgi:hypothetical protein